MVQRSSYLYGSQEPLYNDDLTIVGKPWLAFNIKRYTDINSGCFIYKKKTKKNTKKHKNTNNNNICFFKLFQKED